MKEWGKTAQRIRVPAGTLLGILFLLWMRPTPRSLLGGGVLAACGALVRIWAAGHIDKGRVLARGGPYAHTRNPLYLGSFLMALGVLVAGQGYWLLLPFLAFYLLTYYPVMKAEEGELLCGHGSDFVEYAGRVPLFFPSFGRAVSDSSTFLWSRVVKNREHRTILGLLAAETFLILRTLG